MGLLSSVFDDNKNKEKSLQKEPIPKPEPPKKKEYTKRVTIEWEDKARQNDVFNIKSPGSTFGEIWDHKYCIFRYYDTVGTCRKTTLIPIANIHRIDIEDIEVTLVTDQ